MAKLIGEDAIRESDASSCTQWSQWQLIDSILPTGDFTHSFGLEAAVQTRLVSSSTDLETHIIHVLGNTASLLLPFVYSSLKSPDTETWRRLDLVLDAALTNKVSSKASISQGSALFCIAASAFTEIPSLKMIRDTSLGSKELGFHHVPIFGLVCGLLGMDAETSQRAYLFVTLREDVSAALSLNLVGPMGASVMQHRLTVVAETVFEKWKDRDAGETCQTSALLDVVQGCNEKNSTYIM
ncbi:hypothetical protein Bca101_008727 [Brassica carinata]